MARSITRAASCIGLSLILWLLFITLEPRKTAFSCRTPLSCVGLGRSHHYVHPITNDGSLEVEKRFQDGNIRFRRRSGGSIDVELLILVLVKDEKSWSSDFRSSQRTSHDLMDVIISTKLDLSSVGLALLTSSPKEYQRLKASTNQLPFATVSIHLAQEPSSGISYIDRHDPAVQQARRSALARYRNRLMLSSLEDEKHLLWLDADVVELSDGIVQTMLHQAESHENAGIMTALCHQNQMRNYDKNAWRVNVEPEYLRGPIADADREKAQTSLEESRLMVPDVINGTKDDALVPLDSVGGTILYIRADLVRQGLTFPHFNIVGTTWNNTGWTGVETEGLCYMARSLKGGGCYVLGGKHHVRHSDWG
ncbi:glycosyltransferase family 62 protein [Piedraia hortae CBS 480.64]|uniref:Glycosyltransferase family 62 protein n=1 Tax=Piedraia hortae CBS 480.64 TaxID=1314780 RepID=A0A6A7BR24_9PEZI|nr:glycosyltransferase family 62 protein [Piedraia hortae CBS 480.64]